jgi:hypothetical protein
MYLKLVIQNKSQELFLPDTTHFYRQLESEGRKIPNENSSCIWQIFSSILRPLYDSSSIKFICVFCSSLVLKNKHHYMLLMFCIIVSRYWFTFEWFVYCMESHMHASRWSFSLVDMKIMKFESVLLLKQYYSVFDGADILHALNSDLQ